MKKLTFSAVAIAVGTLFASSAIASVNLDTANSTTPTFASELNYSSGTGGTAISSGKTVTTKLGFGVSGGQDRYIRLDLTGAKLAAASLVGNVPVSTVGFANAILVAGGAVDDTYAIYQVTANAAGHSSTDTVNILLPNLFVTNGNAASVNINYALFETATAAVANAANTSLYSNSGAVLKFGPGLKWALTTGSNTASVETAFKKFNPTTPTVGPVVIGTFDYGVNAVVNAGGGPVTLANLVTGATKAVFTGDFGAVDGSGTPFVASGLTVAVTGGCPGAVATVNTGKTSADFTLGTIALNGDLCYKVDGATAIPAQTINAALDLTAATGSSAADVAAAAIGTILRDGTELQAPWFTTFTGYQSRFVLTSTHTADAAYTAAVITNDGSTCTTGPGVTGTIKAGKQLQVQASDICTAISGFTRAAVVFTIAAPTNKIQGSYVVTAPDGTNSFGGMVRPGTN